MKVKHIIILFLLAYIFESLGFHFKIMHLMGASILLYISSILKVIAAILGVWKVITMKNYKVFLNS